MSASASLSDQTIACLRFFNRWETPLDNEAYKAYGRLREAAPDFETFQKLAPPGSRDRGLFERHLASFEDAGRLIRAGEMREDLFFDSWYGLPAAWEVAQPYVLGMRAEQADPRRYEQFEWLAGRAAQFWQEREQHPPQWQPITHPEPTADDRAVFEAFDRTTPRDGAAWALVDELRRSAPTFEAFQRAVLPSSPQFVTFDWLLCAYDRAGVLTKNGLLHPALLFGAWRSPAEVWTLTETWIRGLQHERHSPHLYENVEWLAEFEQRWRSGAAAQSR
jgi:hypothetical protein